MDKLQSLFEELRNRYAPLTFNIIDDLCNGTKAEQSKAMFPPEEGKSFDYQQAEAGFLKHDCATLTAFRASRTDEENQAMNEHLIADMLQMELDFIPVDGCFREAYEKEASHEDSFFVYDKTGEHDSLKFFGQVYTLSEKYGQDSFLYKCAGMNRTAFLISTNPDSLKQDGQIKLAGKLYFNLPPVGPYTNLGEGRFTFIPEPEPERLMMESAKFKEKAAKNFRVSKKRFKKLLPNAIVLGSDGNVKVGQYTIGRWDKKDVEPFYFAELNNKRQVCEYKQVTLREAIAKACVRGVTGKRIQQS